jgi:phage shock protein C
MEKKLYRDDQHKMIGGVCAGLAEYFDMDVTVVRLLFAFTVIIMGVGLLPYIIMWIVLPKKGYDFVNYNNPNKGYNFVNYNEPKVDYTVPPIPPEMPTGSFGNVTTRRKSNGGLIVGVVLILLGALFLLNEYDLIPDWDFDRLWPLAIVGVGIALIIAGQQKKPWHDPNWHAAEEKAEPTATTGDNSLNDNHPTE